MHAIQHYSVVSVVMLSDWLMLLSKSVITDKLQSEYNYSDIEYIHTLPGAQSCMGYDLKLNAICVWLITNGISFSYSA